MRDVFLRQRSLSIFGSTVLAGCCISTETIILIRIIADTVVRKHLIILSFVVEPANCIGKNRCTNSCACSCQSKKPIVVDRFSLSAVLLFHRGAKRCLGYRRSTKVVVIFIISICTLIQTVFTGSKVISWRLLLNKGIIIFI